MLSSLKKIFYICKDDEFNYSDGSNNGRNGSYGSYGSNGGNLKCFLHLLFQVNLQSALNLIKVALGVFICQLLTLSNVVFIEKNILYLQR